MRKAIVFILLISVLWTVNVPVVEAASIAPGVSASAGNTTTEFETDYTVKGKLGTAPLLPNSTIEIIFPSSFSFGSMFVDHPGLTGTWSTTGTTVKFKTSQEILGGTNLTFEILGVINSNTPGTYTIEMRSTLDAPGTPGEFSNPVTIEDAASGGGFGELEDVLTCSGVVSCIKKVVKAIVNLPKFLINLLVIILQTIISLLITFMIWIGASLIQFAINTNFQLVNHINDIPPTEAAKIGFDITLSLTNIGFVIAIIFIAFATILKMQNFAIRQALPRLIIIAILINFSMFFATAIINISNLLGGGLTSIVIGGSPGSVPDYVGIFSQFFNSSYTAVQIGNLSSIPGVPGWLSTLLDGGLNFLEAAISGFVSIISQVLFGLLVFFTLIATAIMLVIRYIALSFLIMLLPLALLTNIFPGLQIPGGGSPWKKWTENFTKWVIFFPAVMLFTAIALEVAGKLNNLGPYGTFQSLTNVLIVAGLLIGGLLVSQKLGLAGAGFANDMAGWATRRVGGRLGGLGVRGLTLGKRGIGAGIRGARSLATGRGVRDGEPPRSHLELTPEIPVGTAEWFDRRDARTEAGPRTMAEMYSPEEPGVGDRTPEAVRRLETMLGEELPSPAEQPAPRPEETRRLETELGPEATTPTPEPPTREETPETPPTDYIPDIGDQTQQQRGIFRRTREGIRRTKAGIKRGIGAVEKASGSKASNWFDQYARGGRTFGKIIKDNLNADKSIFKEMSPGKTEDVKKAEEKLDSMRERRFNLDDKIATLQDKIDKHNAAVGSGDASKQLTAEELTRAQSRLSFAEGKSRKMVAKIEKTKKELREKGIKVSDEEDEI